MMIPSTLGKSLCSFKVSINLVLHRLCIKVVGEHLIHTFL